MKWNLFRFCQVLFLLFFACQKNREKGSLKLKGVDEITFDTFEVYGGRNYFVREDGLYLSRNNLFHPDYDEGVFRYLVVRFENE
jgi:hypothetical protein